MTLDFSLNLPLILSNNFSNSGVKKDIQGSERIISPATKAQLPNPIQPSMLYMEASLPSQLQSMTVSKTIDCSLNSKLRQLLPPPIPLRCASSSSISSSSPMSLADDEYYEDDDRPDEGKEEETDQRKQNYIPLHLNPTESEDMISFTHHSEPSSTSSSSFTSCFDNTKQYNCSFCHKKFMRPSSLKIHIYSHTGEKPFNCSFPGCRRRFSVQSNMRRHLRVHFHQ